jgi:hypothetical protein
VNSPIVLVVVSSLLSCALAVAQSQTLVTTRTAQLPAEVAGKVAISSKHDVRCDSAGNVLFQLHGDDELLTPFVKVSPTGELVAKITIGTLPNLDKAVIEDFSLGPDGKIYFVVGKVNQRDDWLLRFEADGRFVSESRLNVPGLSAVAFAPFASGSVLVLGHGPFAGIFSPAGNLLRDISHSADLSRSDVSLVTRQGVTAQVASDGNAYVLTGFQFPRVTIFTPSGDVKQTTLLAIKKDEVVVTGKFSDGKIAVSLASEREPSVAVFDALTGQLVGQYRSNQPPKADLVCYSDNQFTFLENEGKLLRWASPSPTE